MHNIDRNRSMLSTTYILSTKYNTNYNLLHYEVKLENLFVPITNLMV